MASHKKLILADDLTGSNDTGVHILSEAESVAVVLHPEEDLSKTDTSNLVVNTNTRFLSPDSAYTVIANLMNIYGKEPDLEIFKKIDSTLRGNVGAEIDAILENSEFNLVCLTTAGPELRRTVVYGECYVNGELLSETEIASDPFHPISTSNISDIVSAQSRYKVGNLLLEELRGKDSGRFKVQSLIDDGCTIIVADSETDDDLQNVVEAFKLPERKVLYAGAAGLFSAMFKHRPKPESFFSRKHSESMLIVLGSLMPLSRRQLKRLTDKMQIGVTVLAEKSVTASASESVRTAAIEVSVNLNHCRTAVLRTEPTQSDPIENPKQMSTAMGHLVQEVLNDFNLGTLVLVGGDSALGVLDVLGVSCLKLLYEVLPGVAAAEADLPDGRTLTVVTKSGSYGDDDVFCRLIEGVKVEAEL